MPDSTRCPLCGKPNRCVMANDSQTDQELDCWCRVEHIPDALLAKLPPEVRGKACICQTCVKAYNASHSE